ncbi:MAG: Gfo/Idh/MocA family protein, partial [Bryobacteraceae bacterium]
MADRKKKKVRYAVVGMGHIAQVAVLPAFANAENAELTALVSGDAAKLKGLARRHNVPKTYSYEKYDDCLKSGDVDAVYIALPNDMHREYTVKAAAAGVHVLCEKPLAVTHQECADMIDACEAGNVKLMTAYRLHFEEANLRAIEIVKSGEIGEVRVFSSLFAMQVKPGNVRLQREKGGGTLYDIGIYCINAARYLFQDEPVEVETFTSNSGDPRFAEVEETASVILRFPQERLAAFTCSFGAASIGTYTLLGTKGSLRLDP